jgi:hypothetical protein
LTLSDQKALAGNCCDDGFENTAICSLRFRMQGWIELHRPDAEIVHIQVDTIVLVMSANNASANKRAQSRGQLANGFAVVLRALMKSIMNDDSIG